MTRLLILLCLAVLSICCGGGGEGSSPSSSSSLKIQMINSASKKNKIVEFDANTPFRISSDLSNRLDPIEATHIRVSFLSLEGDLLLEKEQAIVRFPESPFEVDPDQRFVTVTNPPSGNLTIKLELGQDLGQLSTNTRGETIYYTGQTNIFLAGNVAVIDDQITNTIPIRIKNLENTELGLYSIQGYLDFTDYPVVIDQSDVDFSVEEDLTKSVTSLSAFQDNFSLPNSSIGNTSYITNNIKIRDIQEPLSYFFEVLNISSNYIGFTVGSDLSSPYNYVLRGYVSPSESKLGLPILIDWETTWTKIMTDWFMFHVDQGNISDLPTEEYEEVYSAMSNVFLHVQDIFKEPTSGNTIGQPFIVNGQDLALVEITYEMLKRLNSGDVISDTSIAINFEVKAVAPTLIQGRTVGVNHFFFPSDNVQRQLLVNLEASENPFFIATDPTLQVITASNGVPVLDSSGEFIIRSPLNGEFSLNDLYQSNVLDVSFNTDSVLIYLYQSMFGNP